MLKHTCCHTKRAIALTVWTRSTEGLNEAEEDIGDKQPNSPATDQGSPGTCCNFSVWRILAH